MAEFWHKLDWEAGQNAVRADCMLMQTHYAGQQQHAVMAIRKTLQAAENGSA